MLRCVFDAVTKPDTNDPEQGENYSQNIHNGYYAAGGDDQELKQAPAGQGQGQVPPGRRGQRQRGDNGEPADQAGPGRRRVLKLDRRHDRQRDHDRLQDQHRRAEPPHSAPPPPVSSSRASPAVTTEPVISTAVPRGAAGPASVSDGSRPPSAAVDSSARPAAISIAASSRSAVCTRSGPKICRASSASCSAGIDRGEEFAVTTTAAATGSSWSKIPATSLSALTASTAITSPKPNDSVSAWTEASIPPGLCAESIRTSGLRRTISSRPGEDIIANASATSPASSAAGLSCGPAAPANASTAASAQAALPA